MAKDRESNLPDDDPYRFQPIHIDSETLQKGLAAREALRAREEARSKAVEANESKLHPTKHEGATRGLRVRRDVHWAISGAIVVFFCVGAAIVALMWHKPATVISVTLPAPTTTPLPSAPTTTINSTEVAPVVPPSATSKSVQRPPKRVRPRTSPPPPVTSSKPKGPVPYVRKD